MKWAKIAAVVFGALVVTALGIDAADTLSGKEGTLLSRVIETEGRCPPSMVEVNAILGITCVDRYEVNAGHDCPLAVPKSLIESQKNVDTVSCTGESRKGAVPWSFITRDQALQLCARARKRLPTSAEWYALTVGMVTAEDSCNVSSKERKESGTYDTCVTPHGAYDLVGNLWEWVSDDVIDGMYNSRSLPGNGYVVEVDNSGVAVQTNQNEEPLYGKDYFWSSEKGSFGMVRGGYYDSGTDGGIYTVHADTPTNAASAGIGFRCVM